MTDGSDKVTSDQDVPDDLRASEIRYRRLFESARDGILILDAASRKDRRRAIESGEPYADTIWMVNPHTGEIVWMHSQGALAKNAEGDARFVGIAQNITERKRAEDALVKLNEQLEHRVAERTIELMEMNASLQAETAERQRAELERASILRRLNFAQEDERRHIGRDLHDQLGQGLGLVGMRERAALIGGTVDIESQPDEGATVAVRIPAPPLAEMGGADE